MNPSTAFANPDDAGLVRLDGRSVIRLAGPDWRSLLQGLITQDTLTLVEGEVRYGALLTPQGRLLHDLFIWADPHGALLDVDAQGRADLIARLGLYRLRAKVEIAASNETVWARLPDTVTPANPAPSDEGWRRDPRSPALGWRRIGAPAGLRQAGRVSGDADYDRHRLTVGVPDMTRDALSDKAYAIEADLDLLNGIDFKKGCFVGQETTSRMKRRGTVKTRLVPLSFEGEAPTPGSEVLAGGALRAGEICSGRFGRALALMRLDRAQGGDLSVGERPVRLDPPDWLTPAIAEIAGAAP